MMGQGGCMAIEDAAVLAELLQLSKSVEDALDAYVLRRRAGVDRVQSQEQPAGAERPTSRSRSRRRGSPARR